MENIRAKSGENRRGRGVMFLRILYFLAGFSVAVGVIVFGNYYYNPARGKKTYQKIKEIRFERMHKPVPSGNHMLNSMLV